MHHNHAHLAGHPRRRDQTAPISKLTDAVAGEITDWQNRPPGARNREADCAGRHQPRHRGDRC
jgi:hypothetical protein